MINYIPRIIDTKVDTLLEVMVMFQLNDTSVVENQQQEENMQKG